MTTQTYDIVAKTPSDRYERVVSRGWTDLAEAQAEARAMCDGGADWANVVPTPVPTAKLHEWSGNWPNMLEMEDANLQFERKRDGDLEIFTTVDDYSVYRFVKAVDVPALIAFLQKEFSDVVK